MIAKHHFKTTADMAELEVRPSEPLRSAIALIDRGAVQIAFVTDTERRLLGTVTDGDVRRALLRGETLEAPVEQVMNRGFRYLPATATEADALKFMRQHSLHHIPALDRDGRIVHLFLLDELVKPKPVANPVVVMAGGEGKRLRPLTEECPKPMLPVGGRPLLQIILEQCVEAGFRNFYFSVSYLKEMIKDHFEDGSRWGANITYLEENRPLGTAGSLSLLPETPTMPLLVLNGDVLTRVDYLRLLRFHSEQAASATLCVREHATQIPYGVVRLDDLRVLTLEEKPVLSHYVNAGIYLLEPRLLQFVPANSYFDMTSLLEKAVEAQCRVSAFPIHEYWVDVGVPETLEQAHGEWQ